MKKYKILEFNKKAIDNFINIQKASYDNTTTLGNHKNYLIMLFSRTNKKYTKITLKEVIEILTNIRLTTAEVMKPTIRKFFKYYKIPEISENIPSNPKVLSRQTKGLESVLTPDEINKIIETPKDNLRDKAMIETFITTGIRNNELRNIRISDINISDNITTWVTIQRTKTNTTNNEEKIPIVPNPDNPVARYPKYLIEWYKQNKHLPEDAYLFYSKSQNRYQKQLSKRGMQLIIKRAHMESGINKKITPHIFRHTSATYDGKNLIRNMLCTKYGWTLNSKMLQKYCHHDENQLEEQLLKNAGFTEEEQTKGKKCPNCGEINNINEETCIKCHTIINPDKLTEIYENNLKHSTEFNKIKDDYYRDKIKYEKEINNLNKTINNLNKQWEEKLQDFETVTQNLLSNRYQFTMLSDDTISVTTIDFNTGEPIYRKLTTKEFQKDKKIQKYLDNIRKHLPTIEKKRYSKEEKAKYIEQKKEMDKKHIERLKRLKK